MPNGHWRIRLANCDGRRSRATHVQQWKPLSAFSWNFGTIGPRSAFQEELQGNGSLTCARTTLDKIEVPAGKPADQNIIESSYAELGFVGWRGGNHLTLYTTMKKDER